MKHYLLATLLLAGLVGCSKKQDAAPTTSTTPAEPAVVRAFAPATGAFAIKTSTAPPDILSGLLLQITTQDNGNQTVTHTYTWRGRMPVSFPTIFGQLPAGTGLEVMAKFTRNKSTPLGNGPWYVGVITSTTDPDFGNPKALDYAGAGVLTATPAGYTLPFTAQFISGGLTQ